MAAGVPAGDEGTDGGDESGHRIGAAASDGLSGDDPEEHLDQVERGGSARSAISSGIEATSVHRRRERLRAALVREELAWTIATMGGAPARAAVLAWLESLSDSDVLGRMKQLVPSFDHDPGNVLNNWNVLVANAR